MSASQYASSMIARAMPRYTIQEYLDLEARANVKHEFQGGRIWAMAGGTPEHAAMAMAVGAALAVQLRGKPCRVYSSDARVRVKATGLDTYPDVTVVCGREERDGEDANALTNPVVLVEVTSEGTEEYDRGAKLDHYKRIASLREVVVVSHRERRVEVFRRGRSKWTSTKVTRGVVKLDSVGASIDVDDIYRDPFAAKPKARASRRR